MVDPPLKAVATANALASVPPKVWLYGLLGVLIIYVLFKVAFGKSGLAAVGSASAKIGDSIGRVATGTSDVVDVIATGVAPWRATEESVSTNPLLRPFFNFGYWLSKPGGLFD